LKNKAPEIPEVPEMIPDREGEGDGLTVQRALFGGANGARGGSATNGGRVPNDIDAVLEELAERGWNGPVYAEVRIRTHTPPPIASGPDDDLFDLDPAWQ
jgi:hypothetical protein